MVKFDFMRSAVFVDAGYLYAQGSGLLATQTLSRVNVELDVPKAIDMMVTTSATKTGGAPLLRIYWYDGLLRGELSPDQRDLANTDNVKLRLGIVNLAGQQKGVDSLIVTDLVELARNHAISDAILLSGDEDLRIGVLIAQSFGVRVHLIGIEPSRGSQSRSLLEEADTTTEWNVSDICTFMALKSGGRAPAHSTGLPGSSDMPIETTAELEQAINGYLTSLEPTEIWAISGLEESENIPKEVDRKLLAMCRTKLGKYLNEIEKIQMRQILKNRAKKLATDL